MSNKLKKETWKYPSGRDTKRSSMIGDLHVDLSTNRLYVVSSMKKDRLILSVYDSVNYAPLGKQEVPFGPNTFQFFEPLTPIHETCEVHLRSWMLQGLSQQLEIEQKKANQIAGFIEHIADLLQLNGTDPEEMRKRIVGLINNQK